MVKYNEIPSYQPGATYGFIQLDPMEESQQVMGY
jgi:hypothetical protein